MAGYKLQDRAIIGLEPSKGCGWRELDVESPSANLRPFTRVLIIT